MRNRITYLLACLVVSSGSLAQSIYKDNSYSPAERAEDLVKQLTLEEKVALMMDNSKPVERLGIKPYNWWNEALHGVARSGWATVFPQPIGMAASFSPEALHTAFVAVSDEARAKNAAYSAEGSYKRYQGLTIWTPTVNIYRVQLCGHIPEQQVVLGHAFHAGAGNIDGAGAVGLGAAQGIHAHAVLGSAGAQPGQEQQTEQNQAARPAGMTEAGTDHATPPWYAEAQELSACATGHRQAGHFLRPDVF